MDLPSIYRKYSPRLDSPKGSASNLPLAMHGDGQEGHAPVQLDALQVVQVDHLPWEWST